MNITKKELNKQIDYFTSMYPPEEKITMSYYEYLRCSLAINYMGIYRPTMRKNTFGTKLVDLTMI